MFKNLSQRERMMAIAVAALAPIALVMFLVFSVGGQLNDKNLEIGVRLPDPCRQGNKASESPTQPD